MLNVVVQVKYLVRCVRVRRYVWIITFERNVLFYVYSSSLILFRNKFDFDFI